MLLGALVDSGLSVDRLRAVLATLPCDGYTLSAEPVVRQGIAGHAVTVRLSDNGPSPRPEGQPVAPESRAQPERHLADVVAIIRGGRLSAGVVERACSVFENLADAEAAVHGVSREDIHFHEVGAVDAIVDVVGAVWGLAELGIDKLFASSVPTGTGVVQTSHGPLPVPAPATMELLARANAPLRPSPATTELVTPTGAALLATLATFDQPRFKLEKVGYGFGQKVLPWPNVARLWIGEAPDVTSGPSLDSGLEADEVVVIEANLDDERPEIVGASLDLLLAAGALDVFFTPIQMKRNRPAVKLTVLAPPELAPALSAMVLRETSTLGVRTYMSRRLKTRRWQETVETPWGAVRVKVKEIGAERRAAPEYADCLTIAREQRVPLPEVYDAVRAAAAAAGLVVT
jgi:uncharacterized protein (TIGR00299 family) protein